MIDGIENVASHGVAANTWWIDAGWYISPTGQWVMTGTWDPDPARFPNGMKPIADAAHANGMKFLLWFEPERVMPNTWLYNNHPEWLISPPSNFPPELMYMYNDHFYLLDLSKPDALAWAKNKIGGMVSSYGVDIYRHDCNIYPLWYWRKGEATDRQGMKEIRYICGLYDFWDTLMRDNPNLLIDNCASGGRRIDFEMQRRSLPLWRSDYCWDEPATQCMTQGLSMWIPLTGVGSDSPATYDVRSGMGAHYSLALDWINMTDPGLWATADRIIDQENAVKHLFSGDFYPLTGYSMADNIWVAWQYDRADIGEGIVQVFRRPNSVSASNIFTLKGLVPTGTYVVTYVDNPGSPIIKSGNQLMQSGISFTLGTPGATYVTYKRTQ